ncbi:4'-phosphopantetheinyl transferase family protein [Actinomadura fibrosa]|uniref:4'-phosphopantetheinyl transferase n=1 Tax=Actinomadura fibrosa TaxID=111802 RepID=A0ABW2XYU9_9ACTN|nr:4'-phosphopantetheinyl transferase superfamily protein [Actinomadura fibrosa]
MIERILPPGVAVAAAYDDPAEAVLHPEERPAVARAVDKRRREFTTVRWCARRALADLGLPPAPIVPGDKGAPRWPGGVVGSMTHCDGYRAAAVARAGDVKALGVDAEPHGPLPDGVLDAIAREEELPRLDGLRRASPDVHWDRLLFCAKEAVYKAWFPVARRWLGFEDASLVLDPGGTFTAELLITDGPFTGFEGRWTTGRGIIATAIAVPAERA